MEANHSQTGQNLKVSNLSCSRYDSMLFKALNFSVSSGQLVQIEGKNGSGKTTLLKTLCGFIEPDEGEVLWRGEKVNSVRDEYHSAMSYIGHNNGIKSGLTCIENLKLNPAYTSRLFTTDYERVLEQYGLAGYEDSYAYSLSAGQRRRLALASLSIRNTCLWILDEPFTSLDENGKNTLKMIFQEHLLAGGMILMTSHDLIQWQDVTPVTIRLK
jgi:heme exporter protein A